MVKNSSFLERLKSRFRTSQVRVDAPAGRGAAAEAGKRLDAVATPHEASAVSGRKVSAKEEAVLAIHEGFAELANLLRGMQGRVEDHGERIAGAIDRLPGLGQAQVDLLHGIVAQLERQNTSTQLVVQGLGDLPEVLRGVREALDRAAATDERTARTLGEFRDNMDRIQAGMAQMVEHSRRQADAARDAADGRHLEHIGRKITEEQHRQGDALAGMVERLEETQRSGTRALRDAQADQATRLGKIVEDSVRTNRAILVVLGLTLFALVAITVVLLAGRS